MSWGSGPWGSGSPWGTGSSAPPPTLIAVSGSVIDVEGGTVVRIVGTNFEDPALIELILGGTVRGVGYVHEPRYDLRANRIDAGMPAVPAGVYDLRVTTSGGSATLLAALEAKPHAEEWRVVEGRGKWARAWRLGRRFFGGS